MEKYFSTELHSAMNSDSYRADDFYSTGDEYFATGSQESSQKSEPYILVVTNTTTADITNVQIMNAFANLPLATTNYGLPVGVTVAMGVGSVTYGAFLNQTVAKPFKVGLTLLQSSTTGQANQPLTYLRSDATGQTFSKPLIPVIDPYQLQSGTVPVKTDYTVDGYSAITISRLQASASLYIYFYPSENISIDRVLNGGELNRSFEAPGVLAQNRTVVLK